MSEKAIRNRTILVPKYMQQFSCIGSACEDSCCVGWRVDIDQQTYKKYNRVRNQELKPLFEKNVIRKRSNPSAAAYAKIKMDDTGKCSFLSEENLCKVQLGLGEDYLSNTCAIYPRSINSINGVIEKSATLSCPETARLALLNPDGIVFDEIEEPVETRGNISKELTTNNPRFSNKAQKYFWDLRIFTIQVLQDRSYTLSERLIILGLFYQKVQSLTTEENVDLIPDTITSYSEMMNHQGMKESLMNVPVNLAVQMELCKELVDYRFGQGIQSKRYLECLGQALNGIEYTSDSTVEEVAVRYKNCYDEYYEPFIIRHEYILENYLVNHVFKNLFPFGKNSLYNDYVMLILHYSMIKLHLIGMAGFHKGLSEELVIKLIQSFAKTVAHNSSYLNKMFDLLGKNELTTMAYMAILIKN